MNAPAPRSLVFCILRQSQTYTPARVEWLRSQITDAHLVTIGDNANATIKLRFGWPGWWSKLELMRPDIPGDVFFIDLDTVVVGSVLPFLRTGRTTMLSDFYRPANLQSSVMYLTAADRDRVWREWLRQNPADVISRFSVLRPGFNGDQNFIEEVLGAANVARWQDRPDTPVCSYKVDMLGKGHKPTAGLIVFHGKPRPWDVAPWNR